MFKKQYTNLLIGKRAIGTYKGFMAHYVAHFTIQLYL